MSDAVIVSDKLQMIIGEQLNFGVDFANSVAAGDVISNPTVTIENRATNEMASSALRGLPFISGATIINFTLNSSPLRKGTFYMVTLSCTATGAGVPKTVSGVLTLEIVY